MNDATGRAHRGNIDAWRAVAVATASPVIEGDGLVTFFTDARSANFNPTIVVEPLRDPAGALKERADVYAGRGMRFGFETTDGLDPGTEAAARDRGMVLHSEQPVMVLDRPPEPSPASHEVVEITSERLDAFLEAQAAGFGDDLDELRAFTPASMLSAARLFGIERNGRIVSTSLVCVTGREAGVFGVSTREDERGRGFGRSVTEAAVRAGLSGGADFVYLHASAMGRPVYERMGFRTVSAVRIFRDPEPSV